MELVHDEAERHEDKSHPHRGLLHHLRVGVSDCREPLGYRIKEDSDDEDVAEIMSSQRKLAVKTTFDRYTIATHINLWKLPV